MHFGIIPFDGNSVRSINITSSNNYLIKIRHKGDGNLIVSENDFILEKDEIKTLNFTLYPTNRSTGYYSGNITFDFYRVE